MKALFCVLPAFFAISQLVAQTNFRNDTSTLATDTASLSDTLSFPSDTPIAARDYKTLATATIALRPEPIRLSGSAVILRANNLPLALDIVAIARSSAYQKVGSSRVDLQACKLEYSIVSPK